MRALAITVVSAFAATFIAPIAAALFSGVLGSPFLLLLVFLLLRGYFSDIIGTQRAKAAFRQNLESATLNPADASAHYNLGLIHQSRGELDQARERFERALQIDEGEIDASYQLGRIARQQKRYADAIHHFEHVVTLDPAHSQYEIWREVAATYIAAGQFEDARNALEINLGRLFLALDEVILATAAKLLAAEARSRREEFQSQHIYVLDGFTVNRWNRGREASDSKRK